MGVWRDLRGDYQVPIDGGTPRKLEFPFGPLTFSLDGKLACYVQQRVQGANLISKIIVAPASGGAPLHTFDTPYGMQGLQFTPDGKALAFLLNRNHAANIWEQPLAGVEPFQLTKFTSGDMFAFAWSKDGKRLAFSRGSERPTS
jgi:Tol biopolymer transport system component